MPGPSRISERGRCQQHGEQEREVEDVGGRRAALGSWHPAANRLGTNLLAHLARLIASLRYQSASNLPFERTHMAVGGIWKVMGPRLNDKLELLTQLLHGNGRLNPRIVTDCLEHPTVPTTTVQNQS